MVCWRGGGCRTHCDPMDWSCIGFSVHGISQARILEWIAISSARGSSRPRDRVRVSCVFCMAGRFFTHWSMGDSQRMIEQQFRRNLVPGWLWKAEMPHNTGPLISNLFHKMKSSEPLWFRVSLSWHLSFTLTELPMRKFTIVPVSYASIQHRCFLILLVHKYSTIIHVFP